MARKNELPARRPVESLRDAAQKLNEAVDTAKRLKAKSRDAKRKVKQAKKAAKQASKDARAARKELQEARRLYKKAAARAEKAQAKAVRDRKDAIVTPKKPTRNRGAARPSRKRERTVQRPGGSAWDVGEEHVEVEAAEPTELGDEVEDEVSEPV